MLKHLITRAINQNFSQETLREHRIRGMLASSQFRILSLRLLCKNIKVNIHKTIILPVVFCWCQTGVPLQEQHRLRDARMGAE
jgi:hypothetical protein